MEHNCCKGRGCGYCGYCSGDCEICCDLSPYEHSESHEPVFHGCCNTKTCRHCGYCFEDCELCCNIPPLSQNLNARFKDLWEIAKRFGFRLEGRNCSPKEYFKKYTDCSIPRIFHIKSPFQTEGETYYKVNFTVDIGGEYPKFIFVLVPSLFEEIINNLKKKETFLHRWFYFLYF
jgi:hypothetical protein